MGSPSSPTAQALLPRGEKKGRGRGRSGGWVPGGVGGEFWREVVPVVFGLCGLHACPLGGQCAPAVGAAQGELGEGAGRCARIGILGMERGRLGRGGAMETPRRGFSIRVSVGHGEGCAVSMAPGENG